MGIKKVDSFVKNSDSEVPSEPEYSISRDLLAHMVAAHTSKKFNAIPEQEDFDNADAMIKLLEKRLSEKDQPCPRCGGDHSWCSTVQPGEFG